MAQHQRHAAEHGRHRGHQDGSEAQEAGPANGFDRRQALIPLRHDRKVDQHEADDTEAIWHHVWWGLHYGGRGGPAVLALSALDIALWDLKARRAKLPLYQLLGGFDAHVPCYAGGIDLDLSVEALLKQTDGNLAKGFRAIKMKVGRPDLKSDVARVSAMRKHLGDGFPLMADANMCRSI